MCSNTAMFVWRIMSVPELAISPLAFDGVLVRLTGDHST